MKILLIVITLLTFGNAYGAERQAEHFYQAENGKLINFFAIEWNQQNFGIAGQSGIERSGFANTIRFEKGFLNFLSVGTNLRFAFVRTTNDSADVNHNGASLQNPEVYTYTTFNLGMMDLKAGLTIDYSHEKALVDNNGMQTNQVTGRHAATPYVGINFDLSGIQAGLRVAQEIALSDIETQNPDDTVVKSEGAEETSVDLYGEYHLSSWAAGLLLKYSMFSDMKTAAVSTEVPAVLRINPYFPIYVNETLTLRPELFYDIYQGEKLLGTTYESIDNYGMNLQARFLF